MRKPKGHFSRAPGVVLDILSSFGGGTFFEGQGYWKGVQEPVVYILISTTGRTEEIISLLRSKIASAQSSKTARGVCKNKWNNFCWKHVREISD